MRWFLRRLFPPRLPAPRTKYVGLVHAYSKAPATDGPGVRYDGYWILTEKAGRRKAEKVGDPYNSAFAISREAAVTAWLAGGPLPPLGYHTDSAPPPKPRKSIPKIKATGNVVAFAKKAS